MDIGKNVLLVVQTGGILRQADTGDGSCVLLAIVNIQQSGKG